MRLTVNHIVDYMQQKVMKVGLNGVVNALNQLNFGELGS